MQDTLDQLAQGPKQLLDVLSRLEQMGRLDHPRAPGKWTPRQIAVHLADVETLQTGRYMTFLSEDNGKLTALNPDAWADAGRYATRDALKSAQAFALMRERNLELLRTVTADGWARKATHPIRGEFVFADWVKFVANHDRNHLAQLEEGLA